MNLMVEDIVVEFLASFLIYFLYIGLVVLWFIDGKIKKEQVIHATVACLLAFVGAVLIKQLIPTIRPYIVNGRETDVLLLPTDGAFPSAHTAQAFVLSVTIFLHDRKVGMWFLLSALVIGVARVIANVHYPIDILGGAFLGTIIAVFMDKIHFISIINKFSPRTRKKYNY